MNHFENLQEYAQKQKSILQRSFDHDTLGYLAIVEIPHGVIYCTIQSTQDLEHFKQELRSYPYHYAWRVSELRKVSAYVDELLDYMNTLQIDGFPEEDVYFQIIIQAIKSFLLEEIDPYK
jgi:hypothetical protein